MADNRSVKRWASCLKGRIRAKDGRVFDCLVRDFSASGARVQVSGAVALPGTFELFMPLKQSTFRARVRWRGEREIGLAFDNPDLATPGDPVQAKLLQRLLQLEAENAELRRKLAEATAVQEHEPAPRGR